MPQPDKTNRSGVPARGTGDSARLSDWAMRLRRALLAGLVCLLGALAGFLAWSLTDPVARPVWHAVQRRADTLRDEASLVASSPKFAPSSSLQLAGIFDRLPVSPAEAPGLTPVPQRRGSLHDQPLASQLITRALVAMTLGGLFGMAGLRLSLSALRWWLARRASHCVPSPTS